MTTLLATVLMAPVCADKPLSPKAVFESLFGVAVPKSVTVQRFLDDGPGMDPSFAWEFAPVDRGFVAKVSKIAKLKRVSTGLESSSRWPSAWPHAKVNGLAEAYRRDFEDGGHRHFWVDPRGKRMFAEFLGM